MNHLSSQHLHNRYGHPTTTTIALVVPDEETIGCHGRSFGSRYHDPLCSHHPVLVVEVPDYSGCKDESSLVVEENRSPPPS